MTGMGVSIEETKLHPDVLNKPNLSILANPSTDVDTTTSAHRHGNGDEEHHHREEHLINQKVPNHNKIITSLIAGAVAGAVAKTVIAPLDRTKIHFQISNIQFSVRDAYVFLCNTWRNEGFLALWRGNSATMARIIPYAAIQYTAHEQYKRVLMCNSKRKHLPPAKRFIVGSMAGVTASSMTYPLDLVRARMAVTAKDRYHNLFEVIVKIKKEEGLRTLYRGFVPTLYGSVIYSGLGFCTYETLKKWHAEYNKGKDLTLAERLCFGACAGLLSQSASYPLDIIRRRMQTAGVTGHSHDYRSVSETFRIILKEEGFRRGLYKGLSINWVKGPIAVGVSFATFDVTTLWLRRRKLFHIDELDGD